MTIASELEDLQTNLEAAKDAVEAKGGTVGDTGLAGLADEIASIPSGGGGGNDWGAIKYLDDDNVEHTATIQNAYEFSTLGSMSTSPSDNDRVATVDGADVLWKKITEVHLGESVTHLPQYFLAGSSSNPGILEIIDGLENVKIIYSNVLAYQPLLDCDIVLPKIENIGSNFLYHDSAFNGDVIFGDNLESIQVNFLTYCTSFNKELAIPAKFIGNYGLQYLDSFNSPITFTSKKVQIGTYFLRYSDNFNSDITFADGSSIIVGLGFMSGSPTFNGNISFGSGSSIVIGDQFMGSCTAFNRELDLTGVTSIGTQFLAGCRAFAQNLTIPSSVTSIGNATTASSFMYDCQEFTGILTCETANYPIGTSNNNDLASSSSTAPMYASGVRLSGTYAQTWKDALPDRSTRPYRKLTVV